MFIILKKIEKCYLRVEIRLKTSERRKTSRGSFSLWGYPTNRNKKYHIE
jgi:hypothetical protein